MPDTFPPDTDLLCAYARRVGELEGRLHLLLDSLHHHLTHPAGNPDITRAARTAEAVLNDVSWQPQWATPTTTEEKQAA